MNSTSLLGLMSQWQTIETNITNYMIEAVLKLSSFTEAGVFVVVETSEGRRFAGSNHLVSLYNEGRLRNGGGDQELEGDDSSSYLRPKLSSDESFASQTPQSPAIGRKRRHFSSQDDGLPTKRRTSVSDDDGEIVISDDEEVALSSVIKSENAAPGNADDPTDDRRTSSQLDGIDYGNRYEPTALSVSPLSSDPLYSPAPYFSTPFDFSWVSNEFIAGSKKAQVIVNTGVEDFNEITKKILDSLLYDLGKAAVVKYFSELNEPLSKIQTRHFIDSLFNEWCANFLHMSRLEKLELDYTPEKKYAFKVYMRARLSNSFSSVRRLKSKQCQR